MLDLFYLSLFVFQLLISTVISQFQNHMISPFFPRGTKRRNFEELFWLLFSITMEVCWCLQGCKTNPKGPLLGFFAKVFHFQSCSEAMIRWKIAIIGLIQMRQLTDHLRGKVSVNKRLQFWSNPHKTVYEIYQRRSEVLEYTQVTCFIHD